MSLVRSVLGALALILCAAAAHAQSTCVPNPNAAGPPFKNGCPIPASAFNNYFLFAPHLTGLSDTIESVTGSPIPVVANNPLDGIYSTGGGSLVQMCPGYGFGCPSVGSINAQLATITTTQGNAGTLETGMFAYMVDATGLAPAWATSTVYVANNAVTANGNSYLETVSSCTSASGGSGPSGSGTGIVDGTCRWNDLGLASNNGKLAFNSTNLVEPGGGPAWDADFNTYIVAGWASNFATGTETDITNNSGRDATGNTLTIDDAYLGGAVGTQPITSYIEISPYALNGTNYMAHEGIWFENQYAVKDHSIRFSDSSTDAIFDDNTSVHSTASYYDASTSPNGILLEGTYSTGVALSADATLQASKTAAGATFNGLQVINGGTTANTTSAAGVFQTGTANSYGRLDAFDSDLFNIVSGSAMVNGLAIGTTAGPVNINPNGSLMINGTAGVTCAPGTVSLTTLAINKGIVTHC